MNSAMTTFAINADIRKYPKTIDLININKLNNDGANSDCKISNSEAAILAIYEFIIYVKLNIYNENT